MDFAFDALFSAQAEIIPVAKAQVELTAALLRSGGDNSCPQRRWQRFPSSSPLRGGSCVTSTRKKQAQDSSLLRQRSF